MKAKTASEEGTCLHWKKPYWPGINFRKWLFSIKLVFETLSSHKIRLCNVFWPWTWVRMKKINLTRCQSHVYNLVNLWLLALSIKCTRYFRKIPPSWVHLKGLKVSFGNFQQLRWAIFKSWHLLGQASLTCPRNHL